MHGLQRRRPDDAHILCRAHMGKRTGAMRMMDTQCKIARCTPKHVKNEQQRREKGGASVCSLPCCHAW